MSGRRHLTENCFLSAALIGGKKSPALFPEKVLEILTRVFPSPCVITMRCPPAWLRCPWVAEYQANYQATLLVNLFEFRSLLPTYLPRNVLCQLWESTGHAAIRMLHQTPKRDLPSRGRVGWGWDALSGCKK